MTNMVFYRPSPNPEPSDPSPAYPDFYLCDNYYGSNLNVRDCLYLAEQLPEGDVPVPYTSHGNQRSRETYSLPLYRARRMLVHNWRQCYWSARVE